MADFRAWINEGPGRWVTIAAAALLVVVAVVAAVWLVPWSATEPRADAIRGRGVETRYVCENCGQTGKIRIAFDQQFPIPCPHCGQKKTVPGFTCVQCKQIIAVQKSSYYHCPLCGRVYDYRIPGGAPAPPP